ncbi:MAG: hypothetical protein QXT53_05125 [Ignisphaera sp.]
MRGVSEYVATVIVAIITMAAGVLIFIHSYYIANSYYNALSKAFEESLKSSSMTILASYISGQKLVVLASTGSMPVQIYSIYVNESLANCSIAFNDSVKPLTYSNPIIVPYYTAFVAICNVRNASYASVKIVFDGGTAYAKAQKIG